MPPNEFQSTSASSLDQGTQFDYVKAVHDDYHDALARLYLSAEALQNDFKMLVVAVPLLTGAIAALSGATEVIGIKLPAISEPRLGFSLTFWAFAALATLVAIIGFRDYSRALAFEHQLYSVVRFERHFVRLVRNIVPEGAGPTVTPAAYFIDKFRLPLARLAVASSVVYSIPTLLAPVIVLLISKRPVEAWIMLGYSGVLTVAYTVLGQRVLGRFSDLFRTVTRQALEKDDPEPKPNLSSLGSSST